MKMSEWKEQGAWIWVRWNTGAPQDAWKEWGASNLKVWSTTGEWDCKVWVPAKVQMKSNNLYGTRFVKING
jgi:hypothetical protein